MEGIKRRKYNHKARVDKLQRISKKIEIVAFENVLAYQFFKVHFCSL